MLPSVMQKSLTYCGAPTFDEYLATCCYRDLLATRCCEIRLTPEQQDFFTSYPHYLQLLALVADASPATAVVLPVWAHLVSAAPRLDLRVLDVAASAGPLAVLVEDAGMRGRLAQADLPLLLVFDAAWRLQAQWGPHPQAAQVYLARLRSRHAPEDTRAGRAGECPRPDDPLVQEIRLWYNSGLNRACAEEVCRLLAGLLDAQPGDDAAGSVGSEAD
jgi:hypothetical protein